MNPRTARPLLVAFALAVAGTARAEDEEAQIVTTCHYANAEWGNDMIHLCIEENRRLRAEVLAMPGKHAVALARCRASSELGWQWVKACVVQDAAAQADLAGYPEDARERIAACQREFGAHGFAAVKDCADRAMKSLEPR